MRTRSALCQLPEGKARIGWSLCRVRWWWQGILAKMSEQTRSVVAVLEAVANVSDSISPKSFGSYVISMTRNASNVFEVGGTHAMDAPPACRVCFARTA